MNTLLVQETALQIQPPHNIDLLDRQNLIERIIRLLEVLSETNNSCTFALSGSWGSGKTFVLDMLRKQLEPYESTGKFLVLNYNCWKYDYYEEPIVSIVSAISESVKSKKNLLSKQAHKKIQTVWSAVLPVVKSIAISTIQDRFHLDESSVEKLVDLVKQSGDSMEHLKESFAEQASYDYYDAFNETLKTTKTALQKLSEDHTLLIIVDELDRCLPEYAIKILERLHHLSEELDNCAILLSVDNKQLEHTIKQIFGMDTDSKEYLKKFIDFEIKLPSANINHLFRQKYTEYFSMFSFDNSSPSFDYDIFYSSLFAGIDPRTQEKLMQRIITAHRMAIPSHVLKTDAVLACVELIWLVVCHHTEKSTITDMPFSRSSDNLYHFNIPAKMNLFRQYIDHYWPPINLSWDATEKFIQISYSEDPTPELILWYLYQQISTQMSTMWLFHHVGDDDLSAQFKNVLAILEVIQ